MKNWIVALILFTLPLLAWSGCNITHFCWDWEIQLHTRPTHHAHSLVYCGNIPVYVSQLDYDQMARFQRDDVNMVMTIDGEYIDSPCLPARR